MSRKNFPRAVRVAVIKRATRDSVVYCESCGVPAKRFEIDHVVPDRMGGEPTEENAELLCKGDPECCHDKKTAIDLGNIAKAKRREAADMGARPAPHKPIKSAGFARTAKALAREKRGPRQQLPPRQIYKDARI